MMPNFPGRWVRSAALSFFALHSSLFAGTPAEPALPADLYPQLKDKSDADIRLAGIAALCPGRLLREEPKVARSAVPELRRTRVAELPRGGAYLRLYALDADAVRERAGKVPLVVDCRYLATGPEELEACLKLGSALAGGPAPKLAVRGEYPTSSPDSGVPQSAIRDPQPPVLVLVNRRTAGPLEAVLGALQSDGKVFLVGGDTAGGTGAYKPLAGHSGWWALSGEIFPEGGVSLVGVGVAPKFPVKVAPEAEFLAWQLVERGAPLSGVLRRESLGKTGSASKDGDVPNGGKPSAEATDPALQRAQEVLAALQVLGALPASDKR